MVANQVCRFLLFFHLLFILFLSLSLSHTHSLSFLSLSKLYYKLYILKLKRHEIFIIRFYLMNTVGSPWNRCTVSSATTSTGSRAASACRTPCRWPTAAFRPSSNLGDRKCFHRQARSIWCTKLVLCSSHKIHIKNNNKNDQIKINSVKLMCENKNLIWLMRRKLSESTNIYLDCIGEKICNSLH